jgi:amino acid adenylation domain-containing protein
LKLAVTSRDSSLLTQFDYDACLFNAEDITRLAGQFHQLLESVIAQPEARISRLDLLSEREREQLIVEFNRTRTSYPQEKFVQQLFEEQAARTPLHPAVVFGAERLSYAQLNARANQVAHRLRRLGVGPDSLVGICLERSVEMVVGLLGVLKAGAAYLPLDPKYPKQRLAYMMNDAQPLVLLTQSKLSDVLPDNDAHVICLDRESDSLDGESVENPASVTAGEHLAYVIYTSGSTGQPKGVMIPHRGLANYLHWGLETYVAAAGHGAPVHSSLSFDLTVTSLFCPLLAGQEVMLLEESEGIQVLSETLSAVGDFSLVKITPAHLEALNQTLPAEEAGRCAHAFIIGGEALFAESLNFWRDHAPGTRLINEYGPTETVVGCCVYEMSATDNTQGAVPIGRPINNTEVYLLDSHLQPSPIGVPGELYIGGAGLARGYLHQPHLTAQAFIPHPFSALPGARLYRSGDLARFRPDSSLEFLGRSDQQVKVRGFRIELGEIEAVLLAHEQVREAVVCLRPPDGAAAAGGSSAEGRLVAYVVYQRQDETTGAGGVEGGAEGGGGIDSVEMRGYLSERLPGYMIPGWIVEMERLPLTANGKVDRESLPAPEVRGSVQRAVGGARIRSTSEEVLVGVWEQVLGAEGVTEEDNFFELGGHSLLATQVISRIREAFHVELPLRAIFESPTLADLAQRVEIAVRAQQQLELPPIQPVQRTEQMPLSFAQERLWFLHRLNPESVAYHVLRPMRLSGPLDLGLLERAFSEIVRRHEIYRTIFPAIDGRPVQLVQPPRQVTLSPVDLRHLSEAEREASVENLIAEEGRTPFNLDRGPLWRLTLLRLGDEDHLLMLTEHHMVHDGWTEGRLVSEFLALYSAFSAGQPSPLPELPVQYADFATWQRQCLQGELLDSQLAYWKKQLSGALPVLELPTDRTRPPVETFRGAHQSLTLSEDLKRKLYELSRRHGCTLFMTVFAAFNVLLYRYSGQEDIIVGSPIAGRNRAELEPLIGFFVNTMTLRSDLSGDPTFVELLKRTREVALGAYAHQEMPFEKLVEEVQPQRNLNRQALFQVMFVLHNAPSTVLEIPGLTVHAMRVHNGTSKFDLLLAMREEAEGLSVNLEYNTDIFDEETGARLLRQFQTLLEAIAAVPDEHISRLPLMDAVERDRLLLEWNETGADYPHDTRLHELFEAQVEMTPDDQAVMFDDRQLSYRELNERANQLAHHLRAAGVGPEVRVAICMYRSPEMIVAVLGVLKAGGAYVALDPSYPKERLAYMMEDAGVALVLTLDQLSEVMSEYAGQLIRLDTDGELIARQSKQNIAGLTRPESLIYITYTSGSTGRPKGIGMVQRPLLNLLHWMLSTTKLPERARTLQFASLSFDVSFQDIFSTLCSGGTVVMISEAVRQDIAGLARVLAAREVHRLFIPAVALQQLAEGFYDDEQLSAPLRKVIAGSEQLQITPAIEQMFTRLKAASLHNEYGPSEAHVVTALALAGCPADWPRRPAVGRPISNTQIYILDRHFNPTPVGVPGELYIGGAGLARGYPMLPATTAEKFVPDPFSTEPGARLYRTGDLSRYLADGNIEFLGRMDHQLKIRGFRIEPGEIEVVLGHHPGVQEALVLAHEYAPGDKRLVAYVVLQEESAPTVSAMRGYLKEKLPDYMVPSAFIILDSLPLTTNGKVDRRALPAPDQARPEIEQAFVAPRTALEEAAARIWMEVLGLERVGVHDNFFELGGHSLLATQLISRLCEAFQTELPLRAIFESPTVAGLAERMSQNERQPGEFERIARILNRIEELSEDEAEAMLSESDA